MASNPMQRQKNISFLKGVLVTVLISAIIIGILGYVLYKKIEAEKQQKASMVMVYTLNKDVTSGQVITSGMLTMTTVSRSTVPSNAVSDSSTFASYSLQDNKGNEIYSDSEGMYIMDGNDKIRISSGDNGNYYKKGNNGNEDVTLSEVPLIAKVNMKSNTVITRELVSQSDGVNSNDVRIQEYNMITLPTTLVTGDFIDVRLRLPNGVDYIVISKKEVTVPDIGGIPTSDTIEMNMSEDEILTMSNAMVEAYIMNGAEIYATKYMDPGNQAKSTTTYPVSRQTMELINSDPNIVETAKQGLWARYNTDQRNGTLNSQLNTSDAESKVESGIEAQIQKQKELRGSYLKSLNGTLNN